MRLTAIVPSANRWQHAEAVVRALLPAPPGVDLEVLVVCGETGAPPPEDESNLRYASIPEHDIFVARSVGLTLATGEFVALFEDHVLPDANWATALLAAWEQHPEADAMIYPLTVGPDAMMWEIALFTLTFGPFLGVTEAPRDRIPVPGMVAFRRSLVPTPTPPAGWLEYEFLAQLATEGRIAMTTATKGLHIQPVGWRAPILSFHSGRMYAGSAAADPAVTRCGELRRLRRDRKLISDQTFAARRRITGAKVGVRFAACASAVIAANLIGQLVGVASRSAGHSSTILQ
ncbi:MAG: glycosyltransferase family 2 protein [Actinobacteria bacterium]|nr:glycosyltransferase family 2 protein [Actinomycetota bacterium]